KRKMEKNHKEYYLNEQLKIIQKELGKKDESAEEFNELEGRIASKKLSAEAALIRNYNDTILDLPCSTVSRTSRDINHAARVMDEDHYGLDKVKTRILEHLAVQTLVKRLKGPILCLVGPPGVGKTSLARSIARATSRKFVKMSLG